MSQASGADGVSVTEGRWAREIIGLWCGQAGARERLRTCLGDTREGSAVLCCLQSLHPGWLSCACRSHQSLHPSPVPEPASKKTNYNSATRRPWLPAPALIRVNCSLHDPSARSDRRVRLPSKPSREAVFLPRRPSWH